MKKLAFILALLLLLSACGKTEDTAKAPETDDTVQEATPSTDAEAETPPPSEEPSTAPSEASPDEPIINIPAMPMGGMSAPEGMIPLKDVPIDYNKEQAEADGCCSPVLNEDIWQAFLLDSKNGIPTAVRKVDDFTAKYGMSDVKDIEFDGEQYIVRRYMRDAEKQIEYEQVTVYKDAGDRSDPFFATYSSAEEAALHGCEVMDEYNQPLYGEQARQNFIDKVAKGEKAIYRAVRSLSNGELELYTHVEYDGQYFARKYYNDWDNTITSEIFTYLCDLPYTNLATVTKTHYFTLTHSDEYSYKQLIDSWRAAFSANALFSIPYSEVFSTSEPISVEELEATDWVGPDESQLSDKPKEYTVLPGSDEWSKLTYEEMRASCRQSQGEVEVMTAAALLDTALNYPYIIDIYAFNTLEMGIEAQMHSNLALKELFTRENALYEMVMLSLRMRQGEEVSNGSWVTSLITYFCNNLLTEENNPWPHLTEDIKGQIITSK